ncbi:hypothetical protein HDU76_012713 [Blyttiomyces sp. JEL0837]|nr:hypothetical protein HDU76_012713 [Blyttiomyces sp. JEL0837]
MIFGTGSGSPVFHIGKIGSQNFGISGGAENTNGTGFVVVNPFGQVGVNLSSDFMSVLSGAPGEAIVYVNGSVSFANPRDQLQWSSTEYISSDGLGSLVLSSAQKVTFNSFVNFPFGSAYMEPDTKIYGQTGGTLQVESDNKIRLSAPHVVIPNRLCWHHDTISDMCLIYSCRLPTTNDLIFANTVGNILLQPLGSVNIAGGTALTLGSALSMVSLDGDATFLGNGTITLSPGNGNSINIPFSAKLSLGNGSTTWMYQTSNAFNFESTTRVYVSAPSVTIPDETSLIFGNSSQQIVSSNDTLLIYGPDLVKIVSNNVQKLEI